jgi:hypothetical protein
MAIALFAPDDATNKKVKTKGVAPAAGKKATTHTHDAQQLLSISRGPKGSHLLLESFYNKRRPADWPAAPPSNSLSLTWGTVIISGDCRDTHRSIFESEATTDQ